MATKRRASSRLRRNSGDLVRCYVIVHLSSIDNFFGEGGDPQALHSEWSLAAREFPFLIVVDQGWEGRHARTARKEVSEARGGKWCAWLHHDESEGEAGFGWPRIEAEVSDLLSLLHRPEVVVAGLWKDDCVAEMARRLASRGFAVSIDQDGTASPEDIETEEDYDDDE
jgi:hypothetical protein